MSDDLTQTSEMIQAGPSALRQMMSQYYLEYASYVIKERAIPHLDDGLKPVQRRILHSLYEMDDGKFHKVANVVGNTMKYHPHGDASIYDALVNLANKDYFIDRQGNFGNILTGDVASAARYIECRLTPLAREVLFNPEITAYVQSYDGRNQEPVTLPAKVPILLLQGAEGIAVGMSTRILPHNFNECLDAMIAALKGEPFRLLPDFPQGALMDASEYNDGNGKVRVRASIEIASEKKLIIREIPPTTTTETLIASIEDAADKGKIKIAAITDYTGEQVEIEIQLPRNIYADQTIKALYAYTKCEESVSCNALVIKDNRPVTLSVTEMLCHCAHQLMENLRRELEIALGKLTDQIHAKTLAQIFIENRIYKRIEECETMELVSKAIYSGLAKFRHLLQRDVTDEDLEKLLQIPIRRISLFDIKRNQQEIRELEVKRAEVTGHLAQLKKYTIDYLKGLRKKYGHKYPRRTRIEELEQVNVREIALTNVKVGLDRSGGYVGTAIKCDSPLACTEYDKLAILKWDGTYKVIPIPDKLYVGPVCEVYKVDKEQVYSLIYRDKKTRICFAKRFKIDRFIMDKEYAAIPKGCKVEKIFDRYGVVVRCEFEPAKRQKVDHLDLDFEQIPLRGAQAKGLKLDNKNIVKILQLKRGSDNAPGGPETLVDEGPVAPPDDDAPAEGSQGGEAPAAGARIAPAKPGPRPVAQSPHAVSEAAEEGPATPPGRFKIDEDQPFELG